MASQRAPKQWQLTTNETITSFENWRQNLLYILSLDANFAPFLDDRFSWQKKTSTNPMRGLTDDGQAVPEAKRKTAAKKNAQLDLMLGQIANYCSVISRNSIIKNSTSLSDIWQKIRQHYGFQSTGAHFLDLVDINLKPAERSEDLFQRLTAFIEDNLLTTDCNITHHGEHITVDEDLTPTLENMIVVQWLHLINPGLPQLVKQKYGSELRNKTLASLKPEISQAMSSLLDELRSMEDTKVLRSSAFKPGGRRYPTQYRSQNRRPPSSGCTLCKTAGRVNFSSHTLNNCRFLPESDRLSLGLSRLVTDDLEISDDCAPHGERETDLEAQINVIDAVLDQPAVHRVDIMQSPVLYAHYQNHAVKLTLDTGATTNMIADSLAKAIHLPVKPASQTARQADGITPLSVVGETHCILTRGDHRFTLDALIVKDLDVEIIAGIPFMCLNDISTRPAKHQIVIGGSEIIQYGQPRMENVSIRRTQAFLLRAPSKQMVLLPGDFIELDIPTEASADTQYILEPRFDSPVNLTRKPETAWPPAQELDAVGHTLRITNDSLDPLVLKRNEHLCQIRELASASVTNADSVPVTQESPPLRPSKPFSSDIILDPDNCLPEDIRAEFEALHLKYDDVFNPHLSKYNGASGNIQAKVNMGPTLPPQRKGRLPAYNHEMMLELQKKLDELEEAGVFAKPEQVNVHVEYLNLSFLVRKPQGGYRLVTSFGEVARYSKPQPSLMPNIDDVLRDIGKWTYIIKSDLLKAFYQIPLAHESMKYCGVVTPYKGIRVYTRCAMGMPGSETCLEELMCQVLGHLIAEGCVIKLADDLFCGGNTPSDVLSTWTRVLEALKLNNLRLTVSKTVVCPKSTTVLGWTWSQGTLSANPHRLTALASVPPPQTVQGVRSFIGAYKVLSRVLQGYANFLGPLDQVVAGKQSQEKIQWTEELTDSFKKAQNALKDCKTITIPRPSDCLWIVTDASIKKGGLAATMYARRQDKLLLAGFFNAKLKKNQINWLPCELEALAIGTAVRHFSAAIIQSNSQTQVLTDSRPCVQSYQKLTRGEFSASSRVTTFLSVVSRYNIQVRHIAGAANLPSDYTSRHPSTCVDQSCQICQFVKETDESVILSLSVKDIMQHGARMPFTSRAAWLETQHECPDLRRTHSHLSQGTRPSKKITNIPDVKRYLREVSIASDGVLIVRDNRPFQPASERIVVPRSVIDGLLTAIHIRFEHPSRHQTKLLFNRHFFALDLEKALDRVNSSCHHCMALMSVPKHLHPQSSEPAPDVIGSSFAADVMRRYKQLVFVLRESTSSYTWTITISSEKHDCLRDAILCVCAGIRNLGDSGISVRVDPAPGFISLVDDMLLAKYGIKLVIGNPKNVNKNPVAERAIQELGMEILHLSPEGGPVSDATLALATANMNARIRRGGLSSREIWTQRDQMSGTQLPVDDAHLIREQSLSRVANHPHSSRTKARVKSYPSQSPIQIGDLVYLAADKDKTRIRDKYMVTSISGDRCQVRKFTKTQFRSKSYDVLLQDCYPVLPTVIVPTSPGPIRGLEDPILTSSDHLTEVEEQPGMDSEITTPSLPYDTPPLPEQICRPPDEASTSPMELLEDHLLSSTEVSENTASDLPVNSNSQVSDDDLRRSSRPRRPPCWQTSGEWQMH